MSVHYEEKKRAPGPTRLWARRKVADPSDAVEPMSSFSQLLQRRSAGPSLPTHANAEGVYPCARVDSRLSVRLAGLAVCALAAFALFSRVLYPSAEL